MNKLKLSLAVCAASVVLAPMSASAQMFDGRSLIGTGIGAGIGGAIGSNLAGGGVQDEGTAIGALLGGAIGYGIANRGQSGANYGPYRGDYGSTYGGHYGSAHGHGYHGGYSGGASRYGNNYPGNVYGYRNGYSYGYHNTSSYYAPAPAPAYLPPAQYVYGGSVVSQVYTVPQYSSYTYTPQPVINTVQTQVVSSPPSTYVAPELMSTYCYAGSSKRYDSRGYLIRSSSCN